MIDKDYDPFLAEARLERINQLKAEGEFYNSSLEEKLEEKFSEFDEKISTVFDRHQFRLDEIAVFLHEIKGILEKFVYIWRSIFYSLIGYAIYLIIVHISK